MGANRFYDFLLIHKYLGISKMISLEHDKKMHKRAVFNCPYGFIEVQKSSTSTFIGNDSFQAQSIVWFDYDGGLSAKVVDDIFDLALKIRSGGFFFVTTFAEPPGALDKQSTGERLDWFVDELGEVAKGVTIEDVENSNFHIAVFKTLLAAFKNAFSFRSDGSFIPLLCVKYSDSKAMITVGGGFFDPAAATAIKQKVDTTLPFLAVTQEKLYEIKSLHLTEKERSLFDRAVTSPNYRSRNIELQLEKFGFSADDMEAYRQLVRFLPRYVESIV
jgi:hypothetical protein